MTAIFRNSCRYSFPSRWFVDDERYREAMRNLEVTRTKVKYTGPGNNPCDAAAIRTNLPVPLDCPFYYFEITVLSSGRTGYIGVGMSRDDVTLMGQPGWNPGSFGYHGDDGNMFRTCGHGASYGPTFTKDDVIGCYWNRAERAIGYTKNGVNLGIAFRDVTETVLYPTVGLRTPDAEVLFMTTQEFVTDVDAMWSEQAQRVMGDLNATPLKATTLLSSTIARLIMDYVVHHRCVKTAAAVSEYLLDSGVLTSEDEMNIVVRQRIYDAVVSGNVDEAVSQTEAIAPGTLERHPRVLFRLRCQKFMQMMQGSEDDMHSALQFGRTFLAPSCPGSEDEEYLAKVLSLIAYKQPEQSPCGHLLQPKHKKELADALDGAILEIQGKKSTPPLETVYRQLFVAVNELKAAGDLDFHFIDCEKILIDGLPAKE